MKSVLYLHGFASSPKGRKVEALRRLLEPEGFLFLVPDLNVPSFERLDFEAMVQTAVWQAEGDSPHVIVGSSLGALVALEAVRRGVRAPLVLIAPALGLGTRWTEKLPEGEFLPFFHHREGRELPIHRAFFLQMGKVEAEGEPPESPVVILMGRRDESIPFELVRGVWRRWEASGFLRHGSRFVEIPGGDHGLVDFTDRIAVEIRSAASLWEAGSEPGGLVN